MKKLLILPLVFLTLFGCGDEVQFNTPAFQGSYNNTLWRAKAFSASIDDNGILTLMGTNNFETLELIIPSASVGVYVTGVVNAIEARFTTADGTIFSTNNTPDESISIYPERGEIRIDEIINNTFTGTFRFNAFDATGLRVVNFTGPLGGVDAVTGENIFGGIFYRVPLVEGAIPTDPIACEDTQVQVDNAQMAYEMLLSSNSEFLSSSDFEAACNAYSQALTLQLTYCGDSDGSLQALINSLGSCQLSCEQAQDNTAEAEIQYITATIGNFNDKCAQYLFYLQEQIDICGDADGSIQVEIDSLSCGDDDGDGVPNVFEDFNGDGNLENDDIDSDGIPNYLDNDDDGDGVLTIDEAKDENGNPIDTDGDGEVDYLDNDDDGDGLFSNFESGDTDGNGVPDYLDNDDDGDGILTIDENADPNSDGNPADAFDTDGNGVPDYLQA
jgi:hypothetical protein